MAPRMQACGMRHAACACWHPLPGPLDTRPGAGSAAARSCEHASLTQRQLPRPTAAPVWPPPPPLAHFSMPRRRQMRFKMVSPMPSCLLASSQGRW